MCMAAANNMSLKECKIWLIYIYMYISVNLVNVFTSTYIIVLNVSFCLIVVVNGLMVQCLKHNKSFVRLPLI
jgi:hypothetical protein